MTASREDRPEQEPPADETLVDEEAEAAAEEAARVGGPAPPDSGEDPARRPLIEGGEGESEGFELAEAQLEDIAAHGDEHRFPDRDAPAAEDAADGEFGEADETIPPDG